MKKRVCILLSLALIGTGLLLAGEAVDLTAIWRIKDEGLNRSEVMETLSYLTDVHGPRLTGSPNMKRAQEWAKGKLEEWGLENVHLESYPFGRGWELEHLSVEMLEPGYSPLIAFPKSWTPGTEGLVIAEAIRVDIQKEEDFEKYHGKLKGFFVLTQPEQEISPVTTALSERYGDEELEGISQAPEPGAPRDSRRHGSRPESPFQRKLDRFYIDEGVVALLEPGRGNGGTIFVTSGGQRTRDAAQVPCQLVVAVEHYNRIVRILEKKIPLRLRINVQTRFHEEDLNAYNLIAEIPGSDKKDQAVMLGAHFDSHHSGTGATDNAAGSAVVMEAVRILKAIGVVPKRTIRIALWTGEEQGLLGSRAYVTQHLASRSSSNGPQNQDRQEPNSSAGPSNSGGNALADRRTPPPLNLKLEYSKFDVYFNLDNGTGKIRGIYLQGNEEARAIFSSWMEPFRDMGMTTISIRDTDGTDHLSFDRVGLPGFQFIQDPIEYNSRTHHSNMDVYDRAQRGDLMQASVIMASFVWQAAMRDHKFPRKPLPRDQSVVEE